MNTDIRISVSFKGHRKRKKLKMYLKNDQAVGYLIDLWISVATDRPSGDLSGLDNMDIAFMAGWEGDPDFFVQALIDSKWLDKTEAGIMVHDWPEHNGYASAAKDRSDAARNAAKVRWEKRNNALAKRAQCESKAAALPEHTNSNAEAYAPSPNPYPTPNPNPYPSKEKRFMSDSEEIRLSELLFKLILEIQDPPV